MSEYIVELDGKHSIALRLAFAEEMRGGDFVREEIVRCRDCAHSIADGNGCGRLKDYIEVEPGGFCAWGKRKGDAE